MIRLLPVAALLLLCRPAAGEDYAALRIRVRELARLTTPPAVHPTRVPRRIS